MAKTKTSEDRATPEADARPALDPATIEQCAHVAEGYGAHVADLALGGVAERAASLATCASVAALIRDLAVPPGATE